MSATVRTRPRGFGLVANLAILLLILFTFITVVNVVAGFGELSLLLRVRAGAPVSSAEASGVDGTRSALAGIQTLAFLLCVPAVAAWAYLAKVGARAIGATDMAFSPFAAVAWFFVPVAYLWLPFRAMSETWRASQDPADWRAQPVPTLLKAWWACWLGYLATGRAVGLLLRDPVRVDDYVWGNLLAQANDVLADAAAVLLVLVITGLTNRQDAWHDALQGSEVAPVRTAAAA
jgi:hypothetical protein